MDLLMLSLIVSGCVVWSFALVMLLLLIKESRRIVPLPALLRIPSVTQLRSDSISIICNHRSED
jgi:hypothetical protein